VELKRSRDVWMIEEGEQGRRPQLQDCLSLPSCLCRPLSSFFASDFPLSKSRRCPLLSSSPVADQITCSQANPHKKAATREFVVFPPFLAALPLLPRLHPFRSSSLPLVVPLTVCLRGTPHTGSRLTSPVDCTRESKKTSAAGSREREVSCWRVCEREAEEAVRQQVLRRPKGIGRPHPLSPSKCFPLHLYVPSKVL
jgi:hypothetical protein